MSLDVRNRRSLARSLPPHGIIAEIGVKRGEFSAVILAESRPRELHLIDCWERQSFEQYAERWQVTANMRQMYVGVKRRFAQNGNVHVIRAYSVPASRMFEPGIFDAVYIDANHRQAAEDIAAWWPKVKSGGWLMGHDYCNSRGFTVKDDVDAFVRSQSVELLVTQEVNFPSWAIQKTAIRQD